MEIQEMHIQDYWSKSLKEQGDIQHFSETKTGHGTGAWLVRGIIEVDGKYFCDCEHCEGHNGEKEQYDVEEVVCSASNKAAENAASRVCHNEGAWDSEWVWVNGPFVEQLETFGNTVADIERYRRMIQ